MLRRMAVKPSVLVLVGALLMGCGTDSAQNDQPSLAACDRDSVERWLDTSDLAAWAIGEGAAGLEVDLPDTQPDLSARMKREVLDRCGEAVVVRIGAYRTCRHRRLSPDPPSILLSRVVTMISKRVVARTG